MIWQPFPDELGDADLVILQQENRILSNYPMLLGRLWMQRKVAYWGHGVNFQSAAPNGLREQWKKVMLKHVDWWFAYTNRTVDILCQAGYPRNRITCLDNAIDNESFSRDLTMVEGAQVEELRNSIDAPEGAPVGLFCGSLHREKRLDYMIAAADRVRKACRDFHLVVIGDGPCADEISVAARTRPWLHWVGSRKGAEKAAWFKLADIVVNPGLVGLHILDSFCAGTPMVTTADARHSPEIAYLEHGVNGLVVHGEPEQYAAAVIALLNDRARLEALKKAALQDASTYSLDKMVGRFASGIERCLSGPAP